MEKSVEYMKMSRSDHDPGAAWVAQVGGLGATHQPSRVWRAQSARRKLAGAIFSASRYLATVRRAT